MEKGLIFEFVNDQIFKTTGKTNYRVMKPMTRVCQVEYQVNMIPSRT